MTLEMGDAFAALKCDGRTWAVASIHGDAVRLRAINKAIADHFQPGDNLVYLGNMIGRGAQVVETVDELLLMRRRLMADGVDSNRIVFLRGGQEEMWQKLLTIQFCADAKDVLAWMLGHGIGPTLEAYGSSPAEGMAALEEGVMGLTHWTNSLRLTLRDYDGHTAFYSSLKRAALLDNSRLIFVNAGLDPTRSLADQEDRFWWGGGDFDAIDAPCCGFDMVVRGYDSKKGGFRFSPHTATLDNRCGAGGPLEAVCFNADGTIAERFEA